MGWWPTSTTTFPNPEGGGGGGAWVGGGGVAYKDPAGPCPRESPMVTAVWKVLQTLSDMNGFPMHWQNNVLSMLSIFFMVRPITVQQRVHMIVHYLL